jgi:hypothetical protein
MSDWTPDPPSKAWPLVISLTLALLCPAFLVFEYPLISVALILVWLLFLSYGFVRFGLRGLWFLIGLPLAFSPPFIFFAMVTGNWNFHFAPFW